MTAALPLRAPRLLSPVPPAGAAALRRAAEQRLVQLHLQTGRTRLATGEHRLLHELQVHQVELEMQNAELQDARERTESMLEKYTDLYDYAPVGYFSLTAAGCIELTNLTGAKLLGQPRSQLAGQLLGGRLAAADRTVFQAFLQRVFAGESRQACEVTLAGSATPPRIVSLEARRQPHTPGCRTVMRDITDQRLAEKKMLISETRYRRLFEAAHNGVLLIDPGTRKITDANPFMTKLLGYPQAQLIGKELSEIGLLKDEAASQQMFRQLQRQHEVRYEDLPLESQDGRHREVEVVASLYAENGHSVIQCNIRDITERKRAELAQRRVAVLAATNREANHEIARRRVVETSLRKSEITQRGLLGEARGLHLQLRHLTRDLITAQEDERKKISRELHDDVMQTLVGINVSLASLTQGTGVDRATLLSNIASSQRLVKSSLSAVHRFARDLRPAVLDDFGLIPALQAYGKDLAARKKFRLHLTATGDIDDLEYLPRTTLFRVTQEALSNVAHHARATVVRVHLTRLPHAVRLEVQDNGKSFQVKSALVPGKNQRLGLRGMRERIEMMGGTLAIESSRGRGTLVRAEIPLNPGVSA